MVALHQMFTRPHSLFYTSVWRNSNTKLSGNWLGENMKEVLYMRPGSENLITVWYSDEEFDTYGERIIERVTNDPSWFENIVSSFEREWAQLEPYLHSTEPLSLEALKEFYDHWCNWWELMAITMVIPDIQILPEDIRKRSLALREKTQEYSDHGDAIYMRYIENAHPELSDYFDVLLPEEVFANQFPAKGVLEERKQGWFYTSDTFGTIKELEPALARQDLTLSHPEENLEKITELKGHTAYKGKIEGAVRILQNKEQIPSVQEGNIIVSTMTTPEFVPVMKIAGAFVTDEGGITCHAAIMARELQKPCVVGTKYATRVLKDGDRVEVDADNGVVKILI